MDDQSAGVEGIRCLNCASPVQGAFCPDCGQKAATRRLTLRDILHDITSHLVNLDSRVLRTVVDLTRYPGKVCRRYVAGQRVRYVPPLRYCLTIVAALVLLYAIPGLDIVESSATAFQPSGGGEKAREALQVVVPLVKKHFNLVIFVMLPVLAALTRLFFRRAGFNLAEVGVFVLYVVGHVFLFGLSIVALRVMMPKAGVALRLLFQVVFFTWAAAGFFRLGFWGTIWRSIVVQALFFFTLIVLVGLALLPIVLAAVHQG